VNTVYSACYDIQGTLKIVSLLPDIIINELSIIMEDQQGPWIYIGTSDISLHPISLQAEFTVIYILIRFGIKITDL